jgi:hypothetical protein
LSCPRNAGIQPLKRLWIPACAGMTSRAPRRPATVAGAQHLCENSPRSTFLSGRARRPRAADRRIPARAREAAERVRPPLVMPAKAGIQPLKRLWIPACAGMTSRAPRRPATVAGAQHLRENSPRSTFLSGRARRARPADHRLLARARETAERIRPALVMPANAGIRPLGRLWIPACAGMTRRASSRGDCRGVQQLRENSLRSTFYEVLSAAESCMCRSSREDRWSHEIRVART